MNINLMKEAVKYSNYERINSGKHKFNLSKIFLTKTDKTKKDCIRYLGVVLNSKGEEQDLVVNDLIDSEDGYKFSFSRLFKLYTEITKNVIDVNNFKDEEELVNFISNELKASTLYVSFVEKMTPDKIKITEKVLSTN